MRRIPWYFALCAISAFRPGLGNDLFPKIDPEGSAILSEGLTEFYNDEDQKAVDDFGRYSILAPDSPIGYWRKLLAEYFLLRDKQHTDTPVLDPASYKNIISLANLGIAKARTQIQKGIFPDFNYYVEASILGVRAALESKNDSMFVGRRTIIKAVAIANQSHYPDAGSFLGIINYELGNRSPFIQWLTGLPHDKKAGKAMIFAATIKNDSPFIDDVWFLVFGMETDKHSTYARTDVERVARYLFEKYPKNRSLAAFFRPRHK